MAKSKSFALILGVLIMSFLVGYLVFAWQEPTAPPPGTNVPTPINVGTTAQTKQATLTINPGELQAQLFRDVDAGCSLGGGSWYINPSGASALCGNVGIGTASPGYKLDISGDIRWTGTLQGGSVPWARLTSFPSACASGQYVTAVGSSLTCSAPAGGGIGGSGTANYLTKFTASTTIENSQIYDNGTNLGIGTTGPGAKLEVAGSNPQIIVSGVPRNTHGQIILKRADSGLQSILSFYTAGQLADDWSILTDNTANPMLRFVSQGVYNLLVIKQDGNVGIGTTSPGEKLDIQGNIEFGSGNIKLRYKSGTSPTCSKVYLGRNYQAKTCTGTTGYGCTGTSCTTGSGWTQDPHNPPTCSYTSLVGGACSTLTCTSSSWTEAVCLD